MKKILFIIISIALLLTACATPIPVLTVIPFPSITPSNIPSPTTIPTATAIPLDVSPETLNVLKNESALNPDGGLSTNMRYVESGKEIKFSLESIQIITLHDSAIKEAITIKDIEGDRYFWNKEIKAWTPEFGIAADYKNPEASPFVPLEAYGDGSNHYSTGVYVAEHPGLIAPDASYPYYFVDILSGYRAGYEITINPTGHGAFEKETNISYKVHKPFAYLGLQQTKDKTGYIIYVIVKDNWNPTSVDPNATLPTYHGFDKDSYLEWIKYELIFKFLSNKVDMFGELVPNLPPPPGYPEWPDDINNYDGQSGNPHVLALTDQNIISIFPQEVQNRIMELYPHATDKYNAITNPKGVALEQLPPELSNFIFFTGIRGWR